MSPEERVHFARMTAANAEAVKAEQQRIQKAREAENLAVKSETVKNLLALGILTISQIANTIGVSEDFVINISNNK